MTEEEWEKKKESVKKETHFLIADMCVAILKELNEVHRSLYELKIGLSTLLGAPLIDDNWVEKTAKELGRKNAVVREDKT